MIELSTPTVAAVLGITYRQVDNLLRTGRVPFKQEGAGHHRFWSPDQVHRLQIAVALNNVLLAHGVSKKMSQLPDITQAILNGPDPGGSWVALRGDGVSYAATPAGLFPAALDAYGAIVCRMPELWP